MLTSDTQDLISYKISSKNPITMDEAVEGIGEPTLFIPHNQEEWNVNGLS